MAWNFISRLPAPKCRRDRNQMVIGKHSWMPEQFRCRRVAAHALAWVAAWCKKAKQQSARPIAISKVAWAIATRSYIWLRQPSWQPAHWPGSSARQKISLNDPLARRFGTLKKNH